MVVTGGVAITDEQSVESDIAAVVSALPSRPKSDRTAQFPSCASRCFSTLSVMGRFGRLAVRALLGLSHSMQ